MLAKLGNFPLLFVFGSLCATAEGCNGLTGASDLEKVECTVDCPDATISVSDSSTSDDASDTADATAATDAADSRDATLPDVKDSKTPDTDSDATPGDVQDSVNDSPIDAAVCTVDDDCTTKAVGTICVGRACVSGCRPAKPVTCTPTSSLCCATTVSDIGLCVPPPSDTTKVACCTDAGCKGAAALTYCDPASHTCACVPRTTTDKEWHVSTSGSDATGVGTAACPYQTIQPAVDALVAKKTEGTVVIHSGGYNLGGSAVVVDSLAGPITIKRFGSDSVTVTGGGAEVFSINNAGASIDGLIIQRNGASTRGILYKSPKAASPTLEGSIINVSIPTNLVAGSTADDGIRIENGSSPKIGPSVKISGGRAGIVVRGTGSFPTITGNNDVAGEPDIKDVATNCIFVDGNPPDAPGGTPQVAIKNMVLRNCGQTAIWLQTASKTNTIDTTTISSTSSTVGIGGIRIQGNGVLTVQDTTLWEILGDAIFASDGSSLTLKTVAVKTTKPVVATGDRGTIGGAGINIIGSSATVDLNDVTISQRGGNGISCSASSGNIVISNSRLTNNFDNGIQLYDGCTARLGTPGGDGGVGVPGGEISSNRNGIFVQRASKVIAWGVTSQSNRENGLVCEGLGTLEINQSNFTKNAENGVLVRGSCTATTALDSNTFNTRALANTLTGFCVRPGTDAGVSAISLTNPKFACGTSGDAGVPTSTGDAAPVSCPPGVDYSTAWPAGVTVTSPLCVP